MMRFQEMSRDLPLDEPPKKNGKCLGGTVHLHAGMRIAVSIGTLVILALVVLLYMKFKKAMFVLLIPTTVTVTTFFHVILACYALLIFSFYFFFKPFYIIMVLNWAFDTLHTDKTESYYVQCTVIFASLIIFLAYNCWQAALSVSYHEHLRMQRNPALAKPTVLIVNKPLY
nr:Protein C15C6.1 [Haemonchus contortus]